MIAFTIFLLTLALTLLASISAREILELYGVNFELALTSYKYAAILFYDSSPTGQLLQQEWRKAAEKLKGANDLYNEAEIAMVWKLLVDENVMQICLKYYIEDTLETGSYQIPLLNVANAYCTDSYSCLLLTRLIR
jgi:hypothetical protein